MDEKVNSWWFETSYLTKDLKLVALHWAWFELLYLLEQGTEMING